MSADAWSEWFEKAWAVREEEVYPRLFGSVGANIFALTADIFTGVFRQASFDPRWLTYGVFECAPTTNRAAWLYVSSGLSNAWEDDSPNPDGASGLGMEFVLQVPEQATWAIQRLQHVVAFQILLACGRYPGRSLLDEHDRIPLRSSISPIPSELTWLTIGPSEPFPPTFRLPTGSVDLLTVVGITETEAAFGRGRGGDALLQVLRSTGAFPVTDPRRKSVVGAT